MKQVYFIIALSFTTFLNYSGYSQTKQERFLNVCNEISYSTVNAFLSPEQQNSINKHNSYSKWKESLKKLDNEQAKNVENQIANEKNKLKKNIKETTSKEDFIAQVDKFIAFCSNKIVSLPNSTEIITKYNEAKTKGLQKIDFTQKKDDTQTNGFVQEIGGSNDTNQEIEEFALQIKNLITRLDGINQKIVMVNESLIIKTEENKNSINTLRRNLYSTIILSFIFLLFIIFTVSYGQKIKTYFKSILLNNKNKTLTTSSRFHLLASKIFKMKNPGVIEETQQSKSVISSPTHVKDKVIEKEKIITEDDLTNIRNDLLKLQQDSLKILRILKDNNLGEKKVEGPRGNNTQYRNNEKLKEEEQVFYLEIPNDKGIFDDSKRSTTRDSECFFKIRISNKDRTIAKFTTVEDETQCKRAIMDYGLILKPVCTVLNNKTSGNYVKVEEAGVLKLRENKWELFEGKKCRIKILD